MVGTTVVAPSAPVPPVVLSTVVSAVSLSPITEMALPPTVTGAVMGVTTCVPLAVPSVPSVDGAAPESLGAPTVPVVVSVVSLSPRTEMALPPTVTGAVMGATTCVPPRMLSEPPVVAPSVPEPPEFVLPADESDDSLSPRTEMALPPTVTGAVMGATTCVPLAVPSVPSVDGAAPEPLGAPTVPPVVEPVDSLSPRTEMALPPTVTGAATSATP